MRNLGFFLAGVICAATLAAVPLMASPDLRAVVSFRLQQCRVSVKGVDSLSMRFSNEEIHLGPNEALVCSSGSDVGVQNAHMAATDGADLVRPAR